MIEHTPTFRKWVNRLAIISLSIGMFSMVLIFFYFTQQKNRGTISCEEWMESTIGPLNFQAEVIDITQGEACLGTIELSIDRPQFIKSCECPEDDNLMSWIEKGDSIFKKSEERTFYIKKDKGSLRKFTYPCCE